MKKVCLFIWCLCLFVAGATHVFDNIYFGFLPYRFAPDWLNIYWSSLAILDLLAVFLLIKYRNLGIILTLCIMVSNIVINSIAVYWLHVISERLPLQLQTLFLGFCLGSAYWLWESKRKAT